MTTAAMLTTLPDCESCERTTATRVVRLPADGNGIPAVYVLCEACAALSDNPRLSEATR